MIFLGLGSNLQSDFGDRYKNIDLAINYLRENNINYPDITGYNFIEYKDKIYIIDFGDANLIEDENETSPFVNDFINGLNQWNPDFR